ncbi:MAG: SUMF1/EgtB/PvdO family nonheme iron enzyme [Planctomycetes bacterium]|nr:SUMF1/EgtB/PvdO family nonheme iron enzyme [Planctomycetota bacterium]
MRPPVPRRAGRSPRQAPRPPRAGRARFVALVLAGILAACGGPEADPSAALAGLDALAFVPAGECRLVGRGGVEIRCATDRALLVDRYEITRGEWARWTPRADAEAAPPPPSFVEAWPDAATTWPASGMSLGEARAFAAARRMRLPTAAEWMRIAAGTRAQPFPWGLSRAASVANTAELGLGRPVPVGAFEQGASPDGIYDLLGNVAEWVEAPFPGTAGGDGDLRALAWAMGGSYATRLWKLHDVDAAGRIVVVHVDLDPATRALDVGLRCVADARVWLAQHAPELGATAAEREGLRRIGARWGRDAVPLLEELSAAPSAPSSLRHLLEGARG